MEVIGFDCDCIMVCCKGFGGRIDQQYVFVFFYYCVCGQDGVVQFGYIGYCIGGEVGVIYDIGVQLMFVFVGVDGIMVGVEEWVVFQQVYGFGDGFQC